MSRTSRRRFLGALGGFAAAPLLGLGARRAQAGDLVSPTGWSEDGTRTTLLYVVIDRPEDAEIDWHSPNVNGVRRAAKLLDPSTSVRVVTIADLVDLDEAAIDARHRPLAIIGAGSFTEWFQYGLDATWRRQLDHWMGLIRTMTIPMLAFCGSHQLVGAAFNGWGAVGHMNDEGPPVRISEELALPTPRGLWPWPRVGEEGSYPLVATGAGASDPLVRGTHAAPIASLHHKDMVIDSTGFTLLYEPDGARPSATTGWAQARNRCRVQGMRRDDPGRLLYSTQFHPEISAFDESTTTDVGFGALFIAQFLVRARAWWGDRERIAAR
jgi:GMP synthase-like glutamine amidotransferase